MNTLDVHVTDTDTNRFRLEVLAGLRKPQKELPSKYFYDEYGSQLFDAITETKDYYVTRTETSLMEDSVHEIIQTLGKDVLLIEYGSGSSHKTRILLSAVDELAGYVPIDISKEYLAKSAANIAAEYPHIDVFPVCADYTTIFELPQIDKPISRNVVYFPGSTIGNFEPRPAQQFLERIKHVCGENGILLIGIDLKKDPVMLHRAYNDDEDVTAEFNLNLLSRINVVLGADFNINTFHHYAFFNPRKGCVEMHLVSDRYQTVTIDDVTISFRKGESIWTESSYKYNVDEFSELAALAGFKTDHVWYDKNEWFALVCCSV